MLRFIVYRYISYKDSKISHASLLALRHHLSQPPSPTTDLTAPRPPLPYSPQLYYRPHSPTTSTCLGHLYPPFSSATFIGLIRPIGLIGPTPTPPSPTTHLTAPPPAPALLHYSAIYPRSDYPTYVHTAPYPLLRSHLLHNTIPHTAHTAHTCHTPHRPAHLPHRCTMPPISYRLYHTALPRTPLSSI